MPERQPPPVPVMRAATTSERLTDTLRDVYETAAGQPLGQLLDLLGMSDLRGVANTFSDPDYRDALRTGMAPRRAPRIGGAGKRIPRNSQAGVGTPELNMGKLPRFRSDQGTFIKHEGEWWRVKEQPAGNVYNRGEQGVVLELLPPGLPEPGTTHKVLRTKVIDADALVEGMREAKGVREPKRQVAPKFTK